MDRPILAVRPPRTQQTRRNRTKPEKCLRGAPNWVLLVGKISRINSAGRTTALQVAPRGGIEAARAGGPTLRGAGTAGPGRKSCNGGKKRGFAAESASSAAESRSTSVSAPPRAAPVSALPRAAARRHRAPLAAASDRGTPRGSPYSPGSSAAIGGVAAILPLRRWLDFGRHRR